MAEINNTEKETSFNETEQLLEEAETSVKEIVVCSEDALIAANQALDLAKDWVWKAQASLCYIKRSSVLVEGLGMDRRTRANIDHQIKVAEEKEMEARHSVEEATEVLKLATEANQRIQKKVSLIQDGKAIMKEIRDNPSEETKKKAAAVIASLRAAGL